MTKITLWTQSLLAVFAATGMLATPITALAVDPAPKNLNVNFSISGTTYFNGTDPAALTITKGVVTGTVTLDSAFGQLACPVSSGSSDVRGKLLLICDYDNQDTITLAGTLKPNTSKGSGTFSETFFNEKGEYKAKAQ